MSYYNIGNEVVGADRPVSKSGLAILGIGAAAIFAIAIVFRGNKRDHDASFGRFK